jgi:hypothetical protein
MTIVDNPSPAVRIAYEFDKCKVEEWIDGTITIVDLSNNNSPFLTYRPIRY